MTERTRKLVGAAGLTAWVLTAGPSSAADREIQTVVLHLSDLAGTAAADLGRARAETRRIFDAIGVAVTWADASEGPAGGECPGRALSISLLPPHLVREAARQRGSDKLLGSAVPSAGYALIYSDRISALAPQSRMDEGVLLGRVIAHEVGHLLLPKAHHSSTGLMTAGMDTDPTGLRARFMPEESRAIHERLRSKPGNGGPSSGCGI